MTNIKVYDQFTDYMKDTICLAVVDAAALLFEECPDDFCIQQVKDESIVFGSTNRVVWTPAFGLRVDKTYCTARFIAHSILILGR